jgi:fucose permease
VLLRYHLRLALRCLGRHTKLGGSMLVAAISGGMVFPPMTGAVVVRRLYLSILISA